MSLRFRRSIKIAQGIRWTFGLMSSSIESLISMKSTVGDITPYQLFMLVLCIWSLTIFGADTVFAFSESTKTILRYTDNLLCLLFLADFSYNFAKAPSRLRYMTTWGWIDLLSSIPTLEAFRAARLVRILKVIRAVKSARPVAQYLMTRRAESAGLVAVLSCFLIVVVTSIGILHFEVPAEGTFRQRKTPCGGPFQP